ncbi:NfeD family protein [Sporomusa sp.]|uniref:NfeD family protein n=1 Tax=Sporomusa sp. TaxID=2078658 RepID=UPI002CEE1492|nr:NfeD family protein [Sporomusa sp.]HWR42674.1 NfeD family protein [Sporomusa sp.]
MRQTVSHRILFLLIVTLFTLFAVDRPVKAEAGPVISISIKGEINGGQAALVHKAMADARSKQAQAVLVEIDTFGGLVDAAVSIRDMIIDSPVPTICYVKNRAWSAGALIAISHKHIALAPGGSIGAAEPIPTTEKTVAALKAEFAATANRTGRDPRVAEAMVDKSLGYPGYAEPGQILALTDYQAAKVGYADIVAPDREAVLANFGLSGIEVLEYTQGWQEKLAGRLSDPAVKSFLMSIIFLAVLAEIKTAGLGVAALIGLVAALLFFGSQWITGIAGWLEIILFIGGIGLILFELYTPGVGIFGISGIIAIFASLFLTLGANAAAINLLAISLLVAIVLFLALAKSLPSSKLWARLILKDAETKNAGFSSSQDYSLYLGKTGITTTGLRPAGALMIDGVQLDVVSEGQFIEPNTLVKVVKITGNRIVVRPVNS